MLMFKCCLFAGPPHYNVCYTYGSATNGRDPGCSEKAQSRWVMPENWVHAYFQAGNG